MSFDRPGLSEIDGRVRSDIEAAMPEVPVVRRGSVLAAIARGLAGASHAVHGHAVWIYRQIFPDTADEAQLERMAGFYGIARAEPAPAIGEADATGQDGLVVPAGTELASGDGLIFATTEAVVLAGGVATLPIEARATGAAGNLPAGDALAFVAPIGGVDDKATVAAPGLSGGADAESQARLLERLLLRLRQPPHGGAAHDYEQWALETPGVTRVWVSPNEMGVGTVTVRFAVDDAPHGPAPNAGEVAAVKAYIDQPNVRPVPAEVFVLAPTLAPVDVTLSVTPDTPEVRAAVAQNLADLFRREGAPGAGVFLSHIREAISLAAGEVDHVLAAPAADIAAGPGEVPVLGGVTFT